MTDPWLPKQRVFDPATARAWEGLFTLGGHGLHVRGSVEEALADCPQNSRRPRRPANVTSERFDEQPSRWGTYLAGVFGPHPNLGNELINLPWFLELAPRVDGEPLDMHRSTAQSQRELDLRTGLLRRTVCWTTRSGAEVVVHHERFISAAHPRVCMQRMTLSATRLVELQVGAGIDADVTTNGHDHFRAVHLASPAAGVAQCRVETDGGESVTIRSHVRVWHRPARRAAVPDDAELARDRWDFCACGRRMKLETGLRLEPGDTLVCEKRTFVTSSRDLHPPPLAIDENETWDALLRVHTAAWAERWQTCDVQIDGDEAAQGAVRAALFHLLRAHVDDPRVSIDAKGYSGEAYWGRFFWDSEIFLLPFYLYTDPVRARTLLEFRVRALSAAQENAQRLGYAGARYPWESDGEGRECCPNWQYADHEVHVTADVAYALAHYGAAVNAALPRGPGARVLVETARYWMTRIDHRPDGSPVLLGVMGPDEYAPFTDNNAYTNRMVRFALEAAADVGSAAGAGDAECAAWRTVAAALPIPRHPRDPRLVLQCDGYERRAALPFDVWWKDRTRTLAAQVSQERLYRSQCLKQADALMLMALFPDEFSDEEVGLAWDYYVPKTTHDSSLSPAVHALIALRLGRDADALAFFRRACAVDLEVSRGGAAEGVHIANCGGIWQVLVFGFAGMRSALQSAKLTLDPRLPQNWQRLSFPLVWKGASLSIEISHASVTIHNRSPAPLEARVWGGLQTIAAGTRSHWAR